MRIALSGFTLDPHGCGLLKKLLKGERSNVCVDAVVEHALAIGASYAVTEEPYNDQDYSSDYLGFYAAAFKKYPRHTKRVHLFGEDVSSILKLPLAQQPEALKAVSYFGFIVVRPIAQGPIGRTIIPFPTVSGDLTIRPAARADFRVHFLGVELTIKGAAPFSALTAAIVGSGWPPLSRLCDQWSPRNTEIKGCCSCI